MAYRGKSLRTLRESKQLSLRRIANETRIGTRFLEAIENERFDIFPGKFYFRSFVKEYARVLHLSSDQVWQDIEELYDAWSGELQATDAVVVSEPSPEFWWQRIASYVRDMQEVPPKA